MKGAKWVLAVSCVGALLLLLAYSVPAVSSNSAVGVAASASDLESVVAAGLGSSLEEACTGRYTDASWCKFTEPPDQPAFCANMGFGARGILSCTGGQDSSCTGIPTPWNFFLGLPEHCCTIYLSACRELIANNEVVGCGSWTPAQAYWFGDKTTCVTDGTPNYEE